MLIDLSSEHKHSLSSAELSVIDWLNSHEDVLADYSISEIADASFTSPATVSRAIRKCGYSGIAEVRYRASAKIDYALEGKRINDILSRSLTECQKTIKTLRVDTILRVIHYIRSAEKIYIVARGNTALIGRNFEFQLQLLGYNAYLLSDSQIMRVSEKLFKKDDLVIIFTVKNSTPELEMSAKAAKKKGAALITCCCIQGTSLEQYSDISVFGLDKNTSVIEDFNIMSHLPLQIISRVLIDYLTL